MNYKTALKINLYNIVPMKAKNVQNMRSIWNDGTDNLINNLLNFK